MSVVIMYEKVFSTQNSTGCVQYQRCLHFADVTNWIWLFNNCTSSKMKGLMPSKKKLGLEVYDWDWWLTFFVRLWCVVMCCVVVMLCTLKLFLLDGHERVSAEAENQLRPLTLSFLYRIEQYCLPLTVLWEASLTAAGFKMLEDNFQALARCR